MKNCKKKKKLPNKMTTQSRKERKERKNKISLYWSKLEDCYIILQNQIGAEFFIFYLLYCPPWHLRLDI